MTTQKQMSARPPKPTTDTHDATSFVAGALGKDAGLPWETPDAMARASDKSARKVVNVHFPYDYGLKIQYLRDQGVNIHKFLLGAAMATIDAEIERRIETGKGASDEF